MKPCILSYEWLNHGYPRRKIDGEYIYLHRYILQQKLGRPIKEGYLACHSCNHSNCIQPEHIYEGTNRDNYNDRLKADNTKSFGSYRKEITHCPRGHEYNEENTKYSHRGRSRSCRICDIERSRIYNKKMKEFWAEKNKMVSK